MEWEYKGIIFDDVEVDEDGHYWSQICSDCIKKFNISKHLLDDHGHGICGVKGCKSEILNDDEIETVYIDFPEGEIKEIIA